ncbi:MAG: MFS transporter [Nocardioidaceae bacterium]|nr:MFS transporter [Nocardioidaceae bacterium]
MTALPETASRAGVLSAAYRSLTLGAVALISLIAFEALAVATAMPTVARALDGLPLYALAFAGPLASGVVGMVASGLWSDARGPAGPLWTGTALFVLGLVLAATAPTMGVLVLGRLVQGVGGGLITVALYVVVGRAYPSALHARIFSAFAAAWVLPSLVGPLVAGLVVTHLGWRWVFSSVAVIAIPAAFLLLPVSRIVGRPEQRSQENRGHPARTLAWALGAALAAGLLHVAGQQRGWGAVPLLGIAIAGVVVCAPRLLPAGSLRAAPGLPAAIALRGVAAAAFFTAEAFIPLLLSRERDLSPTTAGLVLTVGACAWSTGSWFQGRPGQRMPPARLLRSGMLAITAGIIAVGATTAAAVPLAVAVVGWFSAGLGMGLVFPTLSVLTLELSTPTEQGTNSAALQLSDSLFSATVLALGGSLFLALLSRSSTAAFVATFATASCLALTGLLISGRTGARTKQQSPV